LGSSDEIYICLSLIINLFQYECCKKVG
jgi:hypothetical protein